MGRLSAFLLSIVAACTLAGAASAYCPPDVDYSVRGEFERGDYVGVVRVLGVTWLDEERRPTRLHGKLMLGAIPGGFDPYVGADYRVEPERTFKGAAAGPLTIFSENTSARTPLTVGARYLVSLERQTGADEYRRVGDLMIDYCGNSAILSNADPALAVIEHAREYKDLETFLERYVYDPARTRAPWYAAAFVHLRKGGSPQVVVYLSGDDWCGSGGCTTLVLSKRNGSYRVISQIGITNLPIRVLDAENRGWRQLGVVVRGGGILPGYEAALAYDGTRYPQNPSVPPARRLKDRRGRIIISEDDTGRPLRAPSPNACAAGKDCLEPPKPYCPPPSEPGPGIMQCYMGKCSVGPAVMCLPPAPNPRHTRR